jgi:hypothetical protein
MYHFLVRLLELSIVAAAVASTVMVLWIAINESRGDQRMITVNSFIRRCKDCPYRVAGSTPNLDGIFAAHICERDEQCCEPDYDYATGYYDHSSHCTRYQDYGL